MTEAFTRQRYTWQELTRNLDTAQELEQIEAAGDYVRVDEASDPKAHVYVRLGDPFGPRRKLRLGGSIDGAEFGRLYLDWPAQSRADGTVPWVKLIIARTYGAVRFQNPDPIELDITGLVKIAPHVIAEGGRRADHRYTLELEPIIADPQAVAYTAGDEVSNFSAGHSEFPAGYTLVDGRHWALSSSRDLEEMDSDGTLLNTYSLGLGDNDIAHDSKRRRIAVVEDTFSGSADRIRFFDLFTRQLVSGEIALPERLATLTYDEFRDAFVGGARNSSTLYVFDAETGDEVRSYGVSDTFIIPAVLDQDRYFLDRWNESNTGANIVDAESGAVLESVGWAATKPRGFGVDRSNGVIYSLHDNGIIATAYVDISYNGRGYATAGACGGTGLIEPENVNISAEVQAARLDNGKVNVQGEAVRAFLELHFGARMPDDYLDHVYLARFERTGRVVGAGAETWASAGIADNFLLELPQRITLTIDSDLEPIY